MANTMESSTAVYDYSIANRKVCFLIPEDPNSLASRFRKFTIPLTVCLDHAPTVVDGYLEDVMATEVGRRTLLNEEDENIGYVLDDINTKAFVCFNIWLQHQACIKWRLPTHYNTSLAALATKGDLECAARAVELYIFAGIYEIEKLKVDAMDVLSIILEGAHQDGYSGLVHCLATKLSWRLARTSELLRAMYVSLVLKLEAKRGREETGLDRVSD